MKLAGLFALGLLSVAGAVCAEPLRVDHDKAWFKPTAVVNSSPACDLILRVEQDAFFSTRERSGSTYAGLVSVEADSYQQLTFSLPDGRRVFGMRWGQDCGGDCSTEQLRIAAKPFDPADEDDTSPATPPAESWHIYQGPDQEFYALGVMSEVDHLLAYRIAGPAELELACEVVLKPEKVSYQTDVAALRAWRSIEAFVQAYRSVTQGEGNCGSLNAHGMNGRAFEQALQEALYRPWYLRAAEVRASATDNPPKNAEEQLRMWGLGGVAEHRAWKNYLSQRERTIEDLARLHREKFGWPEEQAREQATSLIRAALDIGFAFSYSYEPGVAEQPLRQAILERQPLDVIKQIGMPERSKQEEQQGRGYDNLLNAAIEYPEALQYLLSQGLDPNSTNDFGKTPLMYAAQYNQLESARILLAAGADPNAMTHLPDDNCYYTIETSGMTPLHYAVRYASAPMIRMLVSAGAGTFNKTRIQYSEVAESPFDWLKKYASTAAKINPNVSAAELTELLELLRVPSDQDRQRMSADLLARAQAKYARGEFRSAYRSLKVALSAQPTNEQALADMPLMALKAGEFREAISAAEQGIKSDSKPLQASAWFNMGLICERDDVRGRFFGRIHCDGDWVWPFVQAWNLQPTKGRADKLRQVFGKAGVGSCQGSGEALKLWSVPTRNGQGYRVHILHAAGNSLQLDSTFDRVIDNLPLQDLAITVLERGRPNDNLPLINGRTCYMPPISP